MDSRRRLYILAGVTAVLAVVLLMIFGRNQAPEPPSTDGQGIYYTGPRRSKYDPNVWVTAEGKVVPPPPGASPAPASGVPRVTPP